MSRLKTTFFFLWRKIGHQPVKHATMLYNLDMTVMKTNHDNVKLRIKMLINVVEKIKLYNARKYPTRKGKLAFHWLIVLVTMTTHVLTCEKIKIIYSLPAVKITFFLEKESPRFCISSV